MLFDMVHMTYVQETYTNPSSPVVQLDHVAGDGGGPHGRQITKALHLPILFVAMRSFVELAGLSCAQTPSQLSGSPGSSSSMMTTTQKRKICLSQFHLQKAPSILFEYFAENEKESECLFMKWILCFDL